MTKQIIQVPDVGTSDELEVIEVNVSVGDTIEEETTLITLESDKASMDIPSPQAGVVTQVLVKEGDQVKEGTPIVEIQAAGAVPTETAAAIEEAAPVEAEAAPAAEATTTAPASEEKLELRVPDLGDVADVEVIEVTAAAGDELAEEDPLFTLETDKATMDVPSPFAGKLVELTVNVGDKVNEGDLVGYVLVAGAVGTTQQAAGALVAGVAASATQAASTTPELTKAEVASPIAAPTSAVSPVAAANNQAGLVHAGPAVRQLARELGVDLTQVSGSGPKGRLVKEDLQNFVKQAMQQVQGSGTASSTGVQGGMGIPPIPVQDFSQFGEVEEKPMGRLLKAGATNLHRSWLNVPHVTQFDEADITDLESFRKSMRAEAEKQGTRLTPLPFIVKACALALEAFPQFNVSLGATGDTLIWKSYINIGFAVDTPDGLLVAVVKDVDKKNIYQLAKEIGELGQKAQNKQLRAGDMQGGCFTVSSLGSIGGTAFTPIVNAPEVAILGVSKAKMSPVWQGSSFEPRLMLPLSLSYDHRAINGADAARFTAYLGQLLSDVRRMLL